MRPDLLAIRQAFRGNTAAQTIVSNISELTKARKVIQTEAQAWNIARSLERQQAAIQLHADQ